MKKIMYVLPALVVGGAEKIVKDYALHLNNDKFKVVIVTTGPSVNSVNEEILRANDIRMIFLGDLDQPYKGDHLINRVKRRINRYKIFKKVVEKEKPDIIHSHLGVNDFLCLIGAKKNKIKLIHSLHSEVSITFSNKFSLHALGTRYCIKNHNMKLIALHKSMKEEVENLFKTENCIVLNNPIDINRFAHPKKTAIQLKRDLQIPPKKLIIGHVGSFRTPKNHDFLIDIFKRLKEIKENSILLLVGTGELENSIKEKVKESGLEKSVYFLGLRNDVPELMNIMDVIVFPSLFEGFPVTLLEAQAAGVRVVVADSITEEVKQTNLVTFVSLKESAETWAKEISKPAIPKIVDLGLNSYDLKKIISELEEIYSF